MQTRFRYKSLRTVVLATTGLAILGMVVGVMSSALSSKREGELGVAVGIMVFAFFGSVGLALAFYLSDVVVTDTGISRCLLGKTLTEIHWDKIKLVRIAQGVDPGTGKATRVFSFYPATPAGFRLLPSGRIWFAEHGDFSALIEHVNRHIVARGIPVMVQGGTSRREWTPHARIDLAP